MTLEKRITATAFYCLQDALKGNDYTMRIISNYDALGVTSMSLDEFSSKVQAKVNAFLSA